MKAHLYETTNIHEQRIWIVQHNGKKQTFTKKTKAQQEKKRLDNQL